MVLSKSNIILFEDWLQEARSSGGTLLVDKDLSWTSFDVVAKLRNQFHVKKIGHAGTLDPLATGLLILCLGKDTKTIESYQNMSKEYIAEIKLGATTATDDSEGEEQNITDSRHLTKENIEIAIAAFVGKIEQIPPIFSAKKVNGKRAYKLARENKEVELTASLVEIYSIDILEINLPIVKIKVACSKGTYIRSLARDIGQKLGVGGYLSSLRRTRIGEFSAEDAFKVPEIISMINNI